MNPYVMVILLSTLIIFSYAFNLIARKFNIPSVLLLIGTGLLLKQIIPEAPEIPLHTLQLFGTLGLILIVLEGSLDLKIRRHHVHRMLSVLLLSTCLIIGSTIGIALIMEIFIPSPFINLVLYAIPLSIISSAIVIPSIGHIPLARKEFFTFESTFSDVIGILLFNLFAFIELRNAIHVTNFILSFVATIGISLAISFFLAFTLEKIEEINSKESNNSLFILAILILLYSLGKIFHLSSLIVVFIFGLVLNNIPNLIRNSKPGSRIQRRFKINYAQKAIRGFKHVNSELSFLVRTFFFVIFGYTLKIDVLLDFRIYFIGISILILIYLIRYLNLHFLTKQATFPELLIAPRGLITILLYYSIPPQFLIEHFEEGVIFFLVVATSLIMMIGLTFFPHSENSPLAALSVGPKSQKLKV